MDRLGLILMFLSLQTNSSQLAYYKFGSNFGQIFYDYSGSGNHGQNGYTLENDDRDTKPTRTGAYFTVQQSCYIMLPPNNIKSSSISIGSTFSIVMWFNSLDDGDGYLTYRERDSSNYFNLVRQKSQSLLKIYIKRDLSGSTYDSSDIYTLDDTIPKCKFLVSVNTTCITINGAADDT